MRFSLALLALHIGWLSLQDTSIEHWLMRYPTVSTAACLIEWLFPGDGITSLEWTLRSTYVTLNIKRGCEGTELFILSAAAAYALQSPWRSRLLLLLAGLVLAFVLNQARIVALYWTVRNAPGLFELMHAYVAPTAMLLPLAGLLLWFGTLHCVDERRERDVTADDGAVL